MEAGGGEDDTRGHLIDTLLDTGALGIDGNYISEIAANKIDSSRKNRLLSSDVRICSGMDGACTNSNYYLMLTVKKAYLYYIKVLYS